MIKAKIIAAIALLAFLACFAAACEAKSGGGQKNEKINYSGSLRVYNAGEYIDMGVLADFEREFLVKVEYSEFESNEEMYAEIARHPDAYDILVPSDYMVDRLIQEGKLEKLDKGKIKNIEHVDIQYRNPAYDGQNSYSVPYMVGTLGILYNKKYAEGAESWSVLFDRQRREKILMLDSQRDVFGIALKMLGSDLNSGDDGELAMAKTQIQEMQFVYGESETIRDLMVAGEGVYGVVYSGDAKTAIDRNPDLAYAIPKEGSNKWLDAFVIVKGAKNMEAAMQFIDFMCRPNIAVRNMTKTGYTSPIRGAWGEFGGNSVMFPSDEELGRCEAFLYDAEAAKKYERLWEEIY
ncbi:MAG: spermidine/putrescine ABC transporter substrate-binding protein [Oscillospiraceae bacterium]|nr:spermidine/putrescine ABC transporter substrate-binding protein [Oscillospiraceae bacterium]